MTTLLTLFIQLAIVTTILAQSPEFRFIKINGLDGASVTLLKRSFEDPAVFLTNPLLSFEDPAVFFERRLKGFEDPAVFLPKGIKEFEDPAVFLEKYRGIEWVELKLKPVINETKSRNLSSRMKPATHKLEMKNLVGVGKMNSESGIPAIVIPGKTETRILMPKFMVSDKMMKATYTVSTGSGRNLQVMSGSFSQI